MPLFTYKCSGCNHEFEDIVKYDDRNTKRKCPKCKKSLGKFQDKLETFTYSLTRSFSRMREGA